MEGMKSIPPVFHMTFLKESNISDTRGRQVIRNIDANSSYIIHRKVCIMSNNTFYKSLIS